MKDALRNLVVKTAKLHGRWKSVAIAVTAVGLCLPIGLLVQSREKAIIDDLRIRGVILTKGSVGRKSTISLPGEQRQRFEVGPVLCCTLTGHMSALQDLEAVSRFKFIQIVNYLPWGDRFEEMSFDRKWSDIRQNLTDDFFAPVLQLNRLRAVIIQTPSSFTDRTLEVVGQLPELVYVHLESEDFTEAGIRQLASLKNLSILALGKAAVGDSLSALPLEQYIELNLRGARLRVDSLAALPRAKNLVVLKLSEASVTDDMLETLAKLPSLQRVDLSRTAVTAAGLEHLGQSPRLRTVHVDGTAITQDQARTFTSRHPAISVYGAQGESIEVPAG